MNCKVGLFACASLRRILEYIFFRCCPILYLRSPGAVFFHDFGCNNPWLCRGLRCRSSCRAALGHHVDRRGQMRTFERLRRLDPRRRRKHTADNNGVGGIEPPVSEKSMARKRWPFDWQKRRQIVSPGLQLHTCVSQLALGLIFLHADDTESGLPVLAQSSSKTAGQT